jgi:adenylate kinase family enzyme
MDDALSRVIVIGTAGAGKTTLASALSSLLAVPHIELDAIHWGPDWTPLERDTFRAQVEARLQGDRWIVDGNYSSVRDLVWPRATAVVWLNYSFARAYWRVFKRTLRRIIIREELFGGNVETFRAQFLSRESLLWWVIKSHRRHRQIYRDLFDSRAFPQLKLVELTDPHQTQAFLEALARRNDTSNQVDPHL